MISNVQLSENLIRDLETCEIRAWRSIYDSASPDIISQCGLKIMSIDSAFITMVSNADVLAFNRVVGLAMNGPVQEKTVDEITDQFRGSGIKRFFVQLMPDATGTRLPDLLLSKGFRHHNNWVRFYRDTSPISSVNTALRIEKIGILQKERFAELVGTAFGWPQVVWPWMAASVGTPGWYHYIAFDGEKGVATAAFHVSGENAWFGMASTLPEYRKHGTQGALIARRINDARNLGCKTLVVETAEETPTRDAPSYRNMHRYGFQMAYLRPNYIKVFE